MNRTDGGHPTDEVLLAVAHGEHAGAAEAEAHLASCAICAGRLAALANDDHEVAALLGAIDHPVPSVAFEPVRRARALRRGLLTTAATAGLAVAAAALVPSSPLHQLIVGRPTPASSADTAAVPPTVAAGATPAQPIPLASGIAVPPSPGELLVVFGHDPDSGVIEVGRATTGDIAFRSRGGRTGYQVETDRIVIDNQAPAETYYIDVPPGSHRLLVESGDRVLLRWPDDSARRAAPGGTALARVPLRRAADHGP